MISNRTTLGRQLVLLVSFFTVLAFALVAFMAYRQSASILVSTVFSKEQSKVAAMAKQMSGRFESEKQLARFQADALKLYQYDGLTVSSNKETIGGFSVPQLLVDGKPVSQELEIVDQFHSLSHSHATVFAFADNDFVRVATSLKKQDGSRAVGTRLGQSHPGYQSLVSGQPYADMVELFGDYYLTYYQPLRNERGNVFAILFVGLPMDEVMADVFAAIKPIVWGKTGHSIVVNAAGKRRGEILFHHERSMLGRSQLDIQGSDGSRPFSELLDQGEGVITFTTQIDGDAVEQFRVFAEVPGWNWVLLGGSSVGEVSEETAQLLTTILLISAAAAIAMLVGLMVFVKRMVKPLARVTEQVDRFGQGEISQEVDNLVEGSDNEIHRLAGSLSTMGSNLQQLVSQLKHSGDELNHTADSLHVTASDSSSSLLQMSEQTEQLAAAVEEMATSAGDVAQQAGAIAERVGDTKQSTDSSTTVVEEMVSEMTQLDQNLNQSSQAIQAVEARTESISQVTGIIDGIAEQTNLLALNAAIEAARAGEQGRGFAVVADEVRNLARRTQESVHDVVRYIAELQESTGSAVELMQQGQEMGVRVSERANQTGEVLHGVASQVDSIYKMSTSIATTAEEQSQVSQELATGVTEVKQLCESNLKGAQVTLESADSVNQTSATLNQQIAQFR